MMSAAPRTGPSLTGASLELVSASTRLLILTLERSNDHLALGRLYLKLADSFLVYGMPQSALGYAELAGKHLLALTDTTPLGLALATEAIALEQLGRSGPALDCALEAFDCLDCDALNRTDPPLLMAALKKIHGVSLRSETKIGTSTVHAIQQLLWRYDAEDTP